MRLRVKTVIYHFMSHQKSRQAILLEMHFSITHFSKGDFLRSLFLLPLDCQVKPIYLLASLLGWFGS